MTLMGIWILQPASWLVILQVAVGLGFVIFVHELGHFLVAKACGVKCEKFYIGFDINGWSLGKFTWGETEYGIGILPLGGYVKMLGQDDNPAAAAREAQRAKDIIESGDLPPEPTADPHPAWDPRSYPAQTVPERMAIISAGVIMNVIFAVFLAAWAFGLGVQELTCEVSSVRPGGAAWRAGLRTGDEIVAIGSKTEPVFTDLQKGVTLGDPVKGIDFTVRRPSDKSERTVTLHPDTDLGIPTVGVTSPFSVTLPDNLEPGLPGAAARAKPAFEAGDTIRAVDDVPIASYADLIASLMRAPHDQGNFVADRDLHREDCLAGKHMPVHATEPPNGFPRDPLHPLRRHHHLHEVAIEHSAQVGKVADTPLRIVMPVVADQQRVHTVDVLYRIHDEVRVARTRNRHNAVVVAAAGIAEPI